MRARTHVNGRGPRLRIDRRSFFTAAGAMAMAGIVARPRKYASEARAATKSRDVLEEALKYRKVDAHNHGILMDIAPAMMVDTCDRLGIERTSISIPRGETPDEFRHNNDLILNAVREFPDRFIGQCFVNPLYPREALEEIDRCLGEGFAGLGELYTEAKISNPVYFPIFEKCIEEKAHVLMHVRADTGLLRAGFTTDAPATTSIPDDFVEVAQRYPELILIHAHIGGGGDWEYMCKTLRAAPSVYVDTSGSVTDAGMIDFARVQLGVNRLLFATDMNYETGVGKILAADLTEDERRRVFWDNYNDILRKRGLHAD